MNTLRDRCKGMLNTLQRNARLRQGSPVDDLEAFVISERGRAADDRLDAAKTLVLYFRTDEDRDEFVRLVREARPDMITKAIP